MGRWGGGDIKVCGGGGGDNIPISLHCHHQNDSCINMGSDESHFNVPLIVKDIVRRQCQLSKRKESQGGFEPRFLCLPAQRLTTRPNRLTHSWMMM